MFSTVMKLQKIMRAIIGGGVVEDKNSKYFQHYIFADYLSSELFAYDFINDSLYSLPLNNLGTNIHRFS